MAAPIDRSPLKAAPLRDPGQSLRDTSIDLVLGRLLPWAWIASIGWALAVHAWMSERFGWHLSFLSLALVALGLSAICVLQFYFVAVGSKICSSVGMGSAWSESSWSSS